MERKEQRCNRFLLHDKYRTKEVMTSVRFRFVFVYAVSEMIQRLCTDADEFLGDKEKRINFYDVSTAYNSSKTLVNIYVS